ncbi:hypothetical protein B0H11DRAFT_2007981 [Mycena galericulata]|nr:hypothetical protein B0H11DRAFT_2007981 [Mycena galericulata]
MIRRWGALSYSALIAYARGQVRRGMVFDRAWATALSAQPRRLTSQVDRETFAVCTMLGRTNEATRGLVPLAPYTDLFCHLGVVRRVGCCGR